MHVVAARLGFQKATVGTGRAGFTKFTQLHVVTSQFVMVISCALHVRIEDRTGSRHDLVEVNSLL